MKIPDFLYARQRGVVWVCDLAQSTSYLNTNANADVLEDFLPRLHAVGKTVVNLAGGRIFKWTGDGFLGWFPLELERTLPDRAWSVFEAIWYLSVLVQRTRLGCPEISPAFKIRHGVTYEPDGVIYHMPDLGIQAVEILGRAVSLAFRLSSVPASFPNFVAQARVLNEAMQIGDLPIHYEEWRPSDEELLKHFKGEKVGTGDLVRATNKQPQPPFTEAAAVKRARSFIKKIDDAKFPGSFASQFVAALRQGPDWSQLAARDFQAWAKDAHWGVSAFIQHMEKANPKK